MDPKHSFESIDETTLEQVTGGSWAKWGAELGAMAGSVLGPAGTVAGGAFGYWLGSKAD